MGEKYWAAMLVLFAAANSQVCADDKPKDMIVGKWEPAKEVKAITATIEFTKDGKVKFSISAEAQDLKLEGSYKFTDDNTVVIELDLTGKKDSKKVKVVKVTKDELVLKEDGKDEEEKYKKVK